jgi:hypothetical protein
MSSATASTARKASQEEIDRFGGIEHWECGVTLGFACHGVAAFWPYGFGKKLHLSEEEAIACAKEWAR